MQIKISSIYKKYFKIQKTVKWSLYILIIFSPLILRSQDSTKNTQAQTNQIIVSSKEWREEIKDLKSFIKEEQKSKPFIDILTTIVAFTAVIVSIISAYLNYKVFKGQSISSYRKAWNNNLIEFASDFIIKSSDLYSNIEKGQLPVNFEAELISLNKVVQSVIFKLMEIGYGQSTIGSDMKAVINLIVQTKKNPVSKDTVSFNFITDKISSDINRVLSENWKFIQNFN